MKNKIISSVSNKENSFLSDAKRMYLIKQLDDIGIDMRYYKTITPAFSDEIAKLREYLLDIPNTAVVRKNWWYAINRKEYLSNILSFQRNTGIGLDRNLCECMSLEYVTNWVEKYMTKSVTTKMMFSNLVRYSCRDNEQMIYVPFIDMEMTHNLIDKYRYAMIEPEEKEVEKEVDAPKQRTDSECETCIINAICPHYKVGESCAWDNGEIETDETDSNELPDCDGDCANCEKNVNKYQYLAIPSNPTSNPTKKFFESWVDLIEKRKNEKQKNVGQLDHPNGDEPGFSSDLAEKIRTSHDLRDLVRKIGEEIPVIEQKKTKDHINIISIFCLTDPNKE